MEAKKALYVYLIYHVVRVATCASLYSKQSLTMIQILILSHAMQY
jgi:hypothetical protein